MARLVRHEASQPHRLDPQPQPVFICMCGLSKNLPICDGSHKPTRAEPPGKLFVYDASRSKVIEERDDHP